MDQKCQQRKCKICGGRDKQYVLPNEITDTERLDWMIKEEATILTSFDLESRETLFKASHACAEKRGFGYYNTPREAIDAAIREGKKNEKSSS